MKVTNFGRLDPLNDYLFYKVMGEKGDEEQLLSFLNAVLVPTGKEPLIAVEILENKTFTAKFISGKTSVLDVRAEAADHTRINIEVQIKNEHNMDRRSLFYWSQEYSRSLGSGKNYNELPNVIAINIVNFEYLLHPDFHAVFHLREDTNLKLILTDALEIHFLDMVKFRKLRGKDVQGNPLHRWLTWMDKRTAPELLEEVINMDTAIRQAEKKVEYVGSDEQEQHAYTMWLMGQSDMISMKDNARAEGLQEGLSQGISQGVKETAQKLKTLGISVAQIVQATGLSETEVLNL